MLADVLEARERLPVTGAAERVGGDQIAGAGARHRSPALEQTEREAGREPVSGADLVDDLLDAGGRHLHGIAVLDDDGSAVPDAHRGVARARRTRRFSHLDRGVDAEQQTTLLLAAEVPVDVRQYRPLDRLRLPGPRPERRAVVRVERHRNPTDASLGGDGEHGLPCRFRERHGDAGQVNQVDFVERLGRHIVRREAARGRAGAPVEDAALAVLVPLEEDRRRSLLVANDEAQIEPFAGQRLVHHVAKRIGAEAGDPGHRHAQPDERDGEVRLGAAEPEPERRTVGEAPLDAVEQNHRLAQGQDTHRPYCRGVLSTPLDVRLAETRVRPFLEPTPLVPSALGARTLLKLETEQPTGSFKVRGALAALTLLDPADHVVAASAGNHALGIAWAAERLGLEATVVCAENASPAKIEALGRFPVQLVLHGSSYDSAERHALELAQAGKRYVSAYNDPAVVAGGGTLALELLGSLDGPLTIACPAGGGGLVSGVGVAVSERQDVRVIGIEAQACQALSTSVAAGEVVEVEVRPTLADGLAGNLEQGSITVELARRHVDSFVTVTETELAAAIRFLHAQHGLVAEGAGAAAVAAVLAGRLEPEGGPLVCVVSGRNIAEEALAGVLASPGEL